MDRRSFVQLGITAGAAALIAPKTLFAGGSPLNTKLAGGVYYTREAEGRWRNKAGSHAPNIEKVSSTGGETTIKVTTEHGMKGFNHYIVKHTLLDKNFKVIAEKVFDPTKEKAVSTHVVGNYTGPLYAISLCNLHDAWVDAITV